MRERISRKKLKIISENYKIEDIFNADETGLFKALPNKSLVEKSKKNPGLKYFKEGLTVLLCASDNGEKLKPIEMSKIWKPYCFTNLKTKN